MDSYGTGPPLVERDAELSLLGRLADEAARGEGRFAIVVGEAGIGKTALLGAARATAIAGLEPLTARASELEQGFAFGVVRQLLEPILMSLSAEHRERLFDGAAALARPVFEATPAGAQLVDPDFGVLHGLYWLVSALSAERPLALIVDDLHWSDGPSLRFVQFLLARIDGLGVLVVAASRPGATEPAGGLLDHLLSNSAAVQITPARLSVEAVTELASGRLGEDGARLAAELQRFSLGNPLYLHALLDDLERGGDSDPAEITERGSDLVGRLTARRLSMLDSPAAALAQAVTVLGDGCERLHAGALARIAEADEVDSAARALQDAVIFAPGVRLSFSHPVVRASLYEQIAPSARAQLHARAAAILSDAKASRESVAAHLLRADPTTTESARETLTEAAHDALARGAPDVAAAFLARALSEVDAPSARVDLLLTLGLAEARSASPEALTHLQAALDEAPDPDRRITAALAVARLLYFSGRADASFELLAAVWAGLNAEDPALQARLTEQIVSLADLDLAVRPNAAAHIERRLDDRTPPPETGQLSVEDVLLCAHLAIELLMSGEDSEQTAALATRALEGLRRPDAQQAGGDLFLILIWALIVAERFELAEAVLAAALDMARAQGAAIVFAQAAAVRGYVRHRLGALEDGEADVRASLETATLNHWPPVAQIAITVLADYLIERGEPELLSGIAASCGIDLEAIAPTTQGVVLLEARGRLRLALGDARGAADDLLEVGRHLTGWGVRNGPVYMWRSHAALALSALGEHERAIALADEELALARAWGTPRATGIALRSRGLLERGDRSHDLLAESVAVLRGSDSRTELARSLTDQGAALRRANRRADARKPLREGFALAQEIGAQALAKRAHTELWATGARPRTPLRSGLDSLTPSERRIAELASQGRSNPQIAQGLFITVKTVETHLARVYRKLNIDSRDELSTALTGDQ